MLNPPYITLESHNNIVIMKDSRLMGSVVAGGKACRIRSVSFQGGKSGNCFDEDRNRIPSITAEATTSTRGDFPLAVSFTAKAGDRDEGETLSDIKWFF